MIHLNKILRAITKGVLCASCLLIVPSFAEAKKKNTTTSSKSNHTETSKNNNKLTKKATPHKHHSAVDNKSHKKTAANQPITLNNSASNDECNEQTNNCETGIDNATKALTIAFQDKLSSLLTVLPNSITNMSIYNFIKDWYGVKYRLGGTSKTGIDCSAFVQKFYSEVFGVRLLRTAFEQYNTTSVIDDNLKEGDLVFFKVRGSRISHVGIYLYNNFFVHASSSRGVMISNLNDKYWQKYYSGAGRIL
jgi:lipoprotein Spr